MPDQNAATKETRQPPERLFDLGQGLALWRAHIDDLHEQEINARVQPPAMFDRLKTTIGRDARLESLPFCALVSQDPVRIEIVSTTGPGRRGPPGWTTSTRSSTRPG
jgi:hypothetical protein